MAECPASLPLSIAEPERVAVLLPVPVPGPYDYRLPATLPPPPLGSVVRVPLGRREAVGVVWARGSGDGPPLEKLKPLGAVLDTPPLPEALCALVDWVAAYTVQPAGAVLRLALSVPEALSPPEATRAWRLPGGGVRAVDPSAAKLTPQRHRVLTTLAQADGPLTGPDLAQRSGVTAAVIGGLERAGLIEAVAVARDGPPPRPDPHHPGPTLSPAQAAAAAALCGPPGFSVSLLEGVTGAGKTEVYFEAVAHTLRQGRHCLILLPEIALAAQWPARFERRFGVPPVSWHSQLGPATRKRAWRAVARGEAQVVVGARSALFLPFPDLGLIVVDEEHDASYKQEEGVCYHARDMAVVRARLGGAAVVLASATPSLESLENARRGRYRHVLLPSRHGGASLPRVSLIDLRATPPAKWRQNPEDCVEEPPAAGFAAGSEAAPAPAPAPALAAVPKELSEARSPERPGAALVPPLQTGWLAPPLVTAVRETLAAGEQALLYLNRRGYAPLTLCRRCGHRLACPRCSAWLVEHREARRLRCHHCDFQRPLPPTCPACGASDGLVAVGPGVERLADEARARFPDARLVVATSDTITGPTQAAQLARQIGERAVNLIIGTQIMAKGHHYPLLTLVGVVDGDLGLAGGDPRAAERTHQLLHQVAGRAGRQDRPGRVMIQTADPRHPVMEALASGDDALFLETESQEREALAMPPFGRLVALIVSAEDAQEARATAAALARCAPHAPGVTVLGPAPAPLALLRGRHRHRLLLKASRTVRVQPLVLAWLAQVRIGPRVKVQVDVDPISFL